jgi:hypothetical protein
VFRRIGKLLRAWEIYTLIRTFSPTAYVVDKTFEYVLSRIRPWDWVFIGFAALLGIVWVVELVNWGVQLVLAVLRLTGVWHGIWPTWPLLSPLAHPTFDRLVGWLASGILWACAVLVWLFYFLRRLVPTGSFGPTHTWTWEAYRTDGAGEFTFVTTSGPTSFREVSSTSPAQNRPRGVTALALAWLLQLLIYV